MKITQIEVEKCNNPSKTNQSIFEYAIASIVQEVWKGIYILPELELKH